jgi:hypothetical protein
MLTIVEDPLSLQDTQSSIPEQMRHICRKQSIPLEGNAAGNSDNYLNLTGQITIAPLTYGYVPCCLLCLVILTPEKGPRTRPRLLNRSRRRYLGLERISIRNCNI